MKTLTYIALAAGAMSFLLAMIARFVTLAPISIAGGMDARTFLSLTNTCLLLSIIFILLEMLRGKQ